MKTLGCMKVILLPLMISGITMGSSIATPILQTESNRSEESTSCRKENPKEESEELQASQTGSDITEALTNLNQTLKEMAKILLKEKS